MRPVLLLSILLLSSTSSPAFAADPPRLRFPADCSLGENCWLMNLPDTEPEKDKARDYACGTQTYDGHDGTDIAIRDQAEIARGTPVLAAQAGTVSRLRDGVDDKFSNLSEQATIRKAGRECGNGILIEHDANWTTQYCHLRKGGMKVKQGDKVSAGQPIAEIGLSGISDHPHLHLTVRHKGESVDPFTGAELKSGCGHKSNSLATPLWAERVETSGFNLYDGGLTGETPDFGQVSQGRKPPEAGYKSNQLLFWFVYFAAQKGDRIDLSIISPSGRILADYQTVQPENKARQYLYTGQKMPKGLPEKGVYRGEARVTRINMKGETRTETLRREVEVK